MERTEGRFRVEWISAAEGDKYARVLNEMQMVLDNLSADELKTEINKLKPDMEKRLKSFPNVPGVPEAMAYSESLAKAINKLKEIS
jgi:heterodisulfide reductase subunit A2